MTTAAGTPVADNQNCETAEPRGLVLMQDYQLMEKMAYFNRERVPERVVHAKIAGGDLDYHHRDLHDAIARREFPKWKVQVQLMPELDANTYGIHPFDLTKLWPHKDYPVIDVGFFELNRNPQNYFTDVEQAAFEFRNMPPGMGASPDKVLQARLLSYPDAHRYRIGINYAALPINKPRSPVNSYHRDGQTRFDGNGGGKVNYEPNRFDGPIENPAVKEPALKLTGDAGRYNHRDGNEDYRQAGDLYRLMNKADADYGSRAAMGLGIRIDEVTGKAA